MNMQDKRTEGAKQDRKKKGALQLGGGLMLLGLAALLFRLAYLAVSGAGVF